MKSVVYIDEAKKFYQITINSTNGNETQNIYALKSIAASLLALIELQIESGKE